MRDFFFFLVGYIYFKDRFYIGYLMSLNLMYFLNVIKVEKPIEFSWCFFPSQTSNLASFINFFYKIHIHPFLIILVLIILVSTEIAVGFGLHCPAEL